MRGSEFVRDSIDLLSYYLQKVGLNRMGSYIDFPKWLKKKKRKKKQHKNSQKNDYNCFQYALTVALNHQNITNNPQGISKIKSLIDQYNWKEIALKRLGKVRAKQ